MPDYTKQKHYNELKMRSFYEVATYQEKIGERALLMSIILEAWGDLDRYSKRNRLKESEKYWLASAVAFFMSDDFDHFADYLDLQEEFRVRVRDLTTTLVEGKLDPASISVVIEDEKRPTV